MENAVRLGEGCKRLVLMQRPSGMKPADLRHGAGAGDPDRPDRGGKRLRFFRQRAAQREERTYQRHRERLHLAPQVQSTAPPVIAAGGTSNHCLKIARRLRIGLATLRLPSSGDKSGDGLIAGRTGSGVARS